MQYSGAHLELVQHHVPQALIVHHPHVDIHREGLTSHPADHHLQGRGGGRVRQGVAGQVSAGEKGAVGRAGRQKLQESNFARRRQAVRLLEHCRRAIVSMPCPLSRQCSAVCTPLLRCG
jgi:hypothetical protein